MTKIRAINRAEDLFPSLGTLRYHNRSEYLRLAHIISDDIRLLKEQQRQQSLHFETSPYFGQKKYGEYRQFPAQYSVEQDPWPLRILTTALMLSLGGCLFGVTLLTSQQQELPYVLIYIATSAFGLLSTLLTWLLINKPGDR